MRKRKPTLSLQRSVEIYETMVSTRRLYAADTEFFKMSDVWDTLCDGDGPFSMNLYRGRQGEDHKRRAAVVALDGKIKLTADIRFMDSARKGSLVHNFTLAHELAHIELDHHANAAVNKNFKLYSGPYGASIIPPTDEELEADYAAVFFQCGVALADPAWEKARLALRAYSDPNYVGKAQAMVRLDAFQRELNRPRQKVGPAVY